MSLSNSKETPETTWPSVNVAFEFVLPSYQWLLARFEAADSRIQTMIVFAATLTLGVPVLAPSQRMKENLFSSGSFLAAFCLFLTLVAVGMLARFSGSIILANPTVHYRRTLHFSEWEFKKTAVFWAGKHFEQNTETVKNKAIALTIMSLLFAGEVVALLTWLLGS